MPIIDISGDVAYFKAHSQEDISIYACFGWVNGTLYIADQHHAAIIAQLIQGDFPDKYDWETLIAAKQMWGWFTIESPSGDSIYVGEISFSTDDAKQVYGVKAKVVADFREAFPGVSWSIESGIGYTTQKSYGDRAKHQYLENDNDIDDDEDY